MNKLLTTYLYLLWSVVAFAQSSTTLHHAIEFPETINRLQLDLGTTNIEINSTKSSRILIEAEVSISINNDKLLKYAASNGRYEIIESVDESISQVTISNKKANNVIVIQGEECKEFIHYKILIPDNIKMVDILTAAPISMTD